MLRFASDKRWLAASVCLWLLSLAAFVGAARYLRRRSTAILNHVIATDPEPKRQALYLRLKADQLVQTALTSIEHATGPDGATGGAMLPAALHPQLEEAERLYLQSIELGTTPTALLFQLGEVSFLLGRRAPGYLYLARYWEGLGDRPLAAAYRRRAAALDPTAAGAPAKTAPAP